MRINGGLGSVIGVGMLPLRLGYLIKITLALILLEVVEAIRKKWLNSFYSLKF